MSPTLSEVCASVSVTWSATLPTQVKGVSPHLPDLPRRLGVTASTASPAVDNLAGYRRSVDNHRRAVGDRAGLPRRSVLGRGLTAHVRGQRGAGGARRRFSKLSRCRRLIGLGLVGVGAGSAVSGCGGTTSRFGGRLRAAGGPRAVVEVAALPGSLGLSVMGRPSAGKGRRTSSPSGSAPPKIFCFLPCPRSLCDPSEPLPRRGQERASPIRRPREPTHERHRRHHPGH